MIETAHLKQQLKSADSEARIAALRQISRTSVDPMALLTIGLGDSDWRVRKAAVEAFSQVEKPEAFIIDLIGLLHNPENAGLRNAAIEILIGLGPLAVEELEAEIASDDVEVRKFCIDILGEIGDSRCAGELIRSLADGDINVRYAAAETLGKLRLGKAIEPLLELMTDPDPGLKFTILHSLAQIGESIPTNRFSVYLDDRLLRKALFDCFAKVGDAEVIPALVNGLCDPMPKVREAALTALFELRGRFHSIIIECLVKADAERIAAILEQFFRGDRLPLKEAALAIYASVGGNRDLHPLLSCVPDERLRSQVLNVFAEIGPESFGHLLNTFDSSEKNELIALIFIAGELGFAQALPFAHDGVHAVDSHLRHTSTRALGRLGQVVELSPLLHLLDDEVPEIQDAAVDAIAAVGQRHRADVLGFVLPLFGDPDALKRMRIVRILSLLGGDEVEDLLLTALKDPSPRVRCGAVQGLIDHRSAAVLSGITLALTDESADVRRLAVTALGRYPQTKALPVLTLVAEDTDLWVRAAVMRTLIHFSGESVRQLLQRGVDDSVGLVAIAALETTAIVSPDMSRDLLESALEHADEEVVKAAMNQLEQCVGGDWILSCKDKLLNHKHWDVRIHAARYLGGCGVEQASFWLEGRLKIEKESLVRQALTTALSHQLQVQRQAH